MQPVPSRAQLSFALFARHHRRLTKEELERRSKENLLSEVGGKAVEAEEQVKVLRQRINEMEEQMKKTEGVYKEQVGSHGANAASSLHRPPH